MSYTPTKVKQLQPAAADTAALPPALADALATAEQALTEHGRVRATLARTHTRIPELLSRKLAIQSELGRGEIEGKDTSAIREQRLTVESERLSAVAQREGSIEALLSQEPELTEARARLNTARLPYAASAVAEFRVKYDAAILALQMAWATGDELARALRCDVPMPLPVKVSGGPKPTLMEIGIPEFTPVTISRVPGTDLQPVTIDPVAQRVGSALDRLDGALNFAAGIRSALHLETQLSMRASSRGFDPSPSAVYTVTESFISHFDNLEFRPGALVDVSLVPLVSLQRLVMGKKLRLAQAMERAAA